MMLYRFSLTALAVALAAILTLVLLDGPKVWIVVAASVGVVALIVTVWAVVKPLNAVQNGIYLLRSQDYGSRLRTVGQPDADRIVGFFNNLMQALRDERLKNEERNKFLQLLIDASPMGIAICNFDGVPESSNAAYRAFSSPELDAAIAALGLEESATLRLGSASIYRISRLWFMDCGFRRPFILVEQLTDEIRQAERDLFNRIVRTISHEVNNTLSSVMSVMETLGTIHTDDPQITATLASCHGSCSSLSQFVSRYAEIVKLPEPEKERIDLNEFVAGMMPMLARMAPEGILLSTALDAAAGSVEADRAMLERVMINIVRNAIESIAGAGTVTIATAPGGLSVTDDGSGIDPEAARRLFTPFFSTKPSGHGLGLMLVAEILHRHNAAFSLRTDPSTRLTTFSIRL